MSLRVLFLTLGALAAAVPQVAWQLNGHWIGTSGNWLDLQQSGNSVKWVGHSADGSSWVHDFTGSIQDDRLAGTFQDRPGHPVHQSGRLRARLIDDCHMQVLMVAIDGGATTSPSEILAKTPCDAKPALQSSGDDEISQSIRFMQTMTKAGIPSGRLRDLLLKYRDVIPTGEFGRDNIGGFEHLSVSPGQLNNLVNGANDTACGGYQGSVLKWLLSIKFNRDRQVQSQLDGFEFGPVQTEYGGHQAVVIFPAGTDWHLSGVVLDPWVEQRPRMYPIDRWQSMFAFGATPVEGAIGNRLVPMDENTGLFPTTPGPDGRWRYQDVFSGKPTRPDRALVKRKVVGVGSPVSVLIRAKNGRRIGFLPDGTFVNDFGASADVAILGASRSSPTATFSLPDDDYALTLTGTGAGTVHVWNRAMASALMAFDGFGIRAGGIVHLDWKNGTRAGALVPEGGVSIASHVVDVSVRIPR